MHYSLPDLLKRLYYEFLKYLKNEQVSSKKSFRSYISQREEELTNPEIKESHRRFKELS
jgi:hypothetical protein